MRDIARLTLCLAFFCCAISQVFALVFAAVSVLLYGFTFKQSQRFRKLEISLVSLALIFILFVSFSTRSQSSIEVGMFCIDPQVLDF